MQEQLSNIRSWLHKIIWSVPLRPAPFTHKGAKPLKIWKLILRTDFKFLFWDKESFWQNTIGYVVLDIRLRNKHTTRHKNFQFLFDLFLIILFVD